MGSVWKVTLGVLILGACLQSWATADSDEEEFGQAPSVDATPNPERQAGVFDGSSEEATTGAPSTSAPTRRSNALQVPTKDFSLPDFLSYKRNAFSAILYQTVAYQAKVNRDTVRGLIPQFKEVRDEMKTLLNTPHETLEEFQHESQLSDKRLQAVEKKMYSNRQLQQNFTKTHQKYQAELHAMQRSLGLILTNQNELFNGSGSQGTEEALRSDEIDDYLSEYEQSLHTPEQLLAFLQDLKTPGNRVQAYTAALRILTTPATLDPILVQVAGAMQDLPELGDLRNNLMTPLKKIYAAEDKIIEMRSARHQIRIQSSGTQLGTFGRDTKNIQFRPVEDGRYFVIADSSSGYALGIEKNAENITSDYSDSTTPGYVSTTGSYIGVKSISDATGDQDYHWKILPGSKFDGNLNFYVRFENRVTEELLDTDSSQLYPAPSQSGTSQDWELH